MSYPKIVSFNRGVFNEESGWKFEIEFDPSDYRDGQNVKEYRTNASYQGLFVWTENRWQQIKGTGQFSLSKDQAAAKRQILQKFS